MTVGMEYSGESAKIEHSPMTKASAKCVGCGTGIYDPYIVHVQPDLEWHNNCLRCTKCQRELGNDSSCFVREGKAYCREDYCTMFIYRCSGCYQPIGKSELVLRLRAQTYHLQCFRCAMCTRPLKPGEEITFRNNQPICLTDAMRIPEQISPNSNRTNRPLRTTDQPEILADKIEGVVSIDASFEDHNNSGELRRHLEDLDELARSREDAMNSQSTISFSLKTPPRGQNNDFILESMTTGNTRPNSADSSLGGGICDPSTDSPPSGKYLQTGTVQSAGMLGGPLSGQTGMSSLLLMGSEGDEEADEMNDSDDLIDENDDDGMDHHGPVYNSGRNQLSSGLGNQGDGSKLGPGFMGNRIGSRGAMKRSKDQKTTRVRTVLNEKQLHMLRTCYAANPRPDALMKEQLVEMTGLSPRVIRVWFQNKRCKDKKKQIMIKQMEQNHQNGNMSCTLQGVPLVAGSPIPNDISLMNSNSQGIEIQQYPGPACWSSAGSGGSQKSSSFGDTPPNSNNPTINCRQNINQHNIKLCTSPLPSNKFGGQNHLQSIMHGGQHGVGGQNGPFSTSLLLDDELLFLGTQQNGPESQAQIHHLSQDGNAQSLRRFQQPVN